VTGWVEDFDDDVGLGHVTSKSGRRHRFHCTQIAGGSRTIAVGTPVTFTVAPAHHGEWEAVDVSPRG
jgi:cold shock CspA family protein